MKTCTVCKETKGYEFFYKAKREKDGYGYRCKSCDNTARYKSRNRNAPPKENKTKLGYRRRWIMIKYGLAVNEYESILESQNHCCAICGTTNPRGEGVSNEKALSFAVDHDHATGTVRGLLCNLCNRALGFLQDSPDIVEAALNYLKKYK